MKKVLMIVSVVIALGLAGAGFYFYQNSKGAISIEEIVPQGTWAYARFSDVEKRWAQFKTTPLGKNISEIDVAAVLEKSGMSQKQIEATGYTNMKKLFSDPVFGELMGKFFGKEFAVALFPVEIKALNASSLETFLASLTVIIRLKPDVQVAESLSSLFQQLDPNLKITTEEYKKHKINLIEIPKDKISIGYVRIKDLLVLGVGDKPAKRCLDVLAQDTPALTNDPTFHKAQLKQLPAAQTIAYGNLEFIYHDIIRMALEAQEKFGQDDQASLSEEMDKIAQKVAGFEAVSYSSSPVPMDTQKFDILFNATKLDPKIKQMYTQMPGENKTIRFVPYSVMGYKWSNSLDAKLQWEMIKEELKSASGTRAAGFSMEEMISVAEKNLKLSIEGDVLPAIGNEIGGYLSDVTLTGFIPLPKILFFVKTGDRAAMDRVLAVLSANPQVVLQDENYKDVSIRYISLPLGEDFQPGYCFLNDYFLLATSRSMLRESIDASASPGLSLAASASFKSVDMGLTDKTNSVLFLNLEDIFSRAKTMIQWWQAQQKGKVTQQKAFKEGIAKRLKDSQDDLKKEEFSLADLRVSLKSTNDQLKALNAQGLDVAETLAKIDQLEKQIDVKTETVRNFKSDQDELSETIQTFKEDQMSPDLVDMYVQRVIFPVLDGLSYYKFLGSKMIFSPDVLESTVYIKK